jgi:hypothetical protein
VSGGVEEVAPPAAEPEAPAVEPDALGALAPEPAPALLLGAALEPPEAEPDFEASLVPDPLAAELDAPGLAGGVDEAPPVPPTDAEPDEELGAPAEGGVLLGEDAELELDEPGLEALFEVSPPRSQAARPKASATAVASMESFMCPPRLGYKDACK